MSKNVSILILAAGRSSRMDKVKQLLPWGKTTLLGHALEMASNSKARSVYLVLGAYKDLIRKKLNTPNVSIIEHDDWESGMGGSLAAGINSILRNESPDGILVMLSDQPLIDSDYLNQMIEAFSLKRALIIGTDYGPKIGVPALFGSSYFAELKTLEGPRGANSIIQRYSSDCLAINADGKQVDVDTEEVYQELLQSLQ